MRSSQKPLLIMLSFPKCSIILKTGGKIHRIHFKMAAVSINAFEASEQTNTNTADSQAYFFVAKLVAEKRVPTKTPNIAKTE